MSLIDYLNILVRRGWIILLLAVIAAGSGYLFARAQTPVYRSTQIVLMQPSRTDLGLSEANRSILASYAVYLNSSLIAQRVIDDLDLDMMPTELQSRVTIEEDTLRLYLKIEVRDASPDQANRIATAYGETLKTFRDEQNQRARREDRVDAVLQDVARADQVEPRPSLIAIAGGMLGILVGGVIVFALEFLESSVIRRREDLERMLNLPVLTTISSDI